jgi:hypothetical protein
MDDCCKDKIFGAALGSGFAIRRKNHNRTPNSRSSLLMCIFSATWPPMPEKRCCEFNSVKRLRERGEHVEENETQQTNGIPETDLYPINKGGLDTLKDML